MNELATMIIERLRQMDDEATNWFYYGGVQYPTGLRLYGDHLKPNRNSRSMRSKCEPREDAAAHRLVELTGWTHEVHSRYPDGRIGDLLIHTPTGSRAWVELKFVYTYEYTRTKLSKCGTYRKYLLSTSDTEHSVAGDFLKLHRVSRDLADFSVVVMVGFDHEGRYPISIDDIDELKRIAAYNRHDWQEVYASWEERHVLQDTRWYANDPSFRVRCWVWWRSTNATGTRT